MPQLLRALAPALAGAVFATVLLVTCGEVPAADGDTDAGAPRVLTVACDDKGFATFEVEGFDPRKSPAPSFVVCDCKVGSSRVDLQACKLEYSIVSPK